MRPILLSFEVFGNPVEVGSYRFFLVLAIAVGTGVAWRLAKRRGLPGASSALFLLATAPAFVIGARLMHMTANADVYARNPALLFSTRATGFSLYGGLLLAVAIAPVICRLLRVDLWRLADASAPGLALSMATVRVGCFLDGCCPGTPSSLPWAVTAPTNQAKLDGVNVLGLGRALKAALPKPAAMHPVDLYELLAALIGLAAIVWILRRQAADGTAFLVFAVWFSAFRLSNFPLRVPSAGFSGPDWLYPAIYIMTGLTAVALLLKAKSRRKSQGGVPLDLRYLRREPSRELV